MVLEGVIRGMLVVDAGVGVGLFGGLKMDVDKRVWYVCLFVVFGLFEHLHCLLCLLCLFCLFHFILRTSSPSLVISTEVKPQDSRLDDHDRPLVV